jgi:O-antigen ligase
MLTGLGAGTYPSVFQRYARLDDGQYAYHAHSDPLEFLAETGLIGVGLMTLFAALLVAGYVQLTLRFEDFGITRYIALAALAGLAGVFCAMSVDFPMQIPGLLGLATLYAGLLRGATQEANREAYLMLEEFGAGEQYAPLRYGPDGETLY